MGRLTPPPGGAKKVVSSVSPETSSIPTEDPFINPAQRPKRPSAEQIPAHSADTAPRLPRALVSVDAPLPHFDLSHDSSDPSEVLPASAPAASYLFPPFRAAARRAFHLLRPSLKDCPYERIFMVALDLKGTLKGTVCIAEGGIVRAPIPLPDLLLQARTMGAAGIILVQNHPGLMTQGHPVDAHISIKAALACDLLGIPLIEHVYIDPLGDPLFMRERGALQGVDTLFHTVHERLAELAVQAWKDGLCDTEYYERKRARVMEEKRKTRLEAPPDTTPPTAAPPKPTPEVIIARRPAKLTKRS
jgi:RadC-like JAB domain